jgi:hypothetical protein
LGYRQDFATIAFLVTDGNPERLTVNEADMRCGRFG